MLCFMLFIVLDCYVGLLGFAAWWLFVTGCGICCFRCLFNVWRCCGWFWLRLAWMLVVWVC